MEIVPAEDKSIPITKGSYKDTLLTGPGLEGDHDEYLSVDDREPNPEDKWYQDDEDGKNVEKPFNPCPTIPVSKEKFEEWCKPWKNALMVKVLGKRVTFAFMEQRLRRDWESKGKIHVIDMNHDYFLVHFSDEEDYTHALMEGPWMIAGHYLIIQRWRPFFLSGPTEVRKIAAWIRIPNLPIELYNHRFLWRVGSTIGHMLKVDRTTSIHSREKFARICVEIDLAKQLVPRISVLGSELHLEYEGLHQICFSCGKYGHRSDQCMENLAAGDKPMEDTHVEDTTPVEVPVRREGDQNGKSENPQNQQNHDNDIPNADFGPWMLVKRYVDRKKAQSRQNKSQANQVKNPSHNSIIEGTQKRKDPELGSRFAILHGESAEIMQDTKKDSDKGQEHGKEIGPQKPQAQEVTGRSQTQKRTPKPGAGKNPQTLKKTTPTPRVSLVQGEFIA
ncbi:uncharacterized protein LOC107632613 [Arachis ipaensis]|uniref:uncharacterized protein LOC107632613 n=1 Tax=Arachis ipaensis TaxID=130454 RepID=UPI0007AFA539|nr:uncharacterized protein LOC107632613 [Arachis ipaensis]XP_025637641.1 uncharacterized protein LOC112733012 [Arachis hypogaea]